MIEKLEQFPLERFYFLESREFLDQRFKIFIKSDNSFKINSYYLGMSKRRINNDKTLTFYNGLRGYYDVRSRFVKNPNIMIRKPPMSKKTLELAYKPRRYKYQDLIIISLKKFSRPTITLKVDPRGSGEIYQFPYRLLHYLNEKRRKFLIKKNFNYWKQMIYQVRPLKYLFSINIDRRRKSSYRSIKLINASVLGFDSERHINYYELLSKQLLHFSRLVNKIFHFNYAKRKRAIKRFKSFYKARKIIQLFLLNQTEKKSFIRKKQMPFIKGVKVPKLDKITLVDRVKQLVKKKRKQWFGLIKSNQRGKFLKKRLIIFKDNVVYRAKKKANVKLAWLFNLVNTRKRYYYPRVYKRDKLINLNLKKKYFAISKMKVFNLSRRLRLMKQLRKVKGAIKAKRINKQVGLLRRLRKQRKKFNFSLFKTNKNFKKILTFTKSRNRFKKGRISRVRIVNQDIFKKMFNWNKRYLKQKRNKRKRRKQFMFNKNNRIKRHSLGKKDKFTKANNNAKVENFVNRKPRN